MVSTDEALLVKIQNFRSTVAPDLFTPQDIVDFETAEKEVGRLAPIVVQLKQLASEGMNRESLAHAMLNVPELYGVLCGFLSISTEVALEDGRRLPRPSLPPRDPSAAADIAGIFEELGIRRLLTPGVDPEKLLLLAQINDDASKRRFRVDAKIRKRVHSVVVNAVSAASNSGLQIELASSNALSASLKRMADYLILIDGAPRAIVANTFQSHGGGRQTRELTSTYPQLAKDAGNSGLELILIADGKGMCEMSARTLRILFEAVPHTLTFSQATRGDLVEVMKKIANTRPHSTVKEEAVERLIESGLTTGSQVRASDLPLSDDAARLALAEYVSRNADLNLELNADATEISWGMAESISKIRSLQSAFSGPDAVQVVGNLFGGTDPVALPDSNLAIRIFDSANNYFHVIGVGSQFAAPNAAVLRELAREVLQGGLSCRLAILVVAESTTKAIEDMARDAQASLPFSVVVLDLNQCLAIAQSSKRPDLALQEIALRQSDLSKLSPFVVRGVAPDRVFFGREEEEATLLSTLATNSVALLGGRRIGKTSLLRHSTSRLNSANLTPYFGDCQVVRTWSDFGALAARNWSVSVDSPFVPSSLFKLVDQLRERSGGNVVFLLDEIDQLLDWDMKHTDDDVPEAFFRTCRSISQQGLAQFVFSGERTIAERIWDAASPHWNFCRPLMLRQLSASAASSLILEPLFDLGIEVNDAQNMASTCWARTDGHPELIQIIGDGVVSLLNRRPRENIYCDSDDVLEVTSNFEFAEQYLETYWGQATALERLLSTLLQSSSQSIDSILSWFESERIEVDSSEVQRGLRMLELYGIADQQDVGYVKRLSWFDAATHFYGGTDNVRNRFVAEVRR